MEVTVLEYLDEFERSPFGRWFNGLNAPAAARVTTALYRLAAGNFSSVKGVGGGVFEYRIDFGPGFRIYFGKDGDRWVILLGGGSKTRQSLDITCAQENWRDYKHRHKHRRKPASGQSAPGVRRKPRI